MAAGVEGKWGAAWGGVFEVRVLRRSGGRLERGSGLGDFSGCREGKAHRQSACATERQAVVRSD